LFLQKQNSCLVVLTQIFFLFVLPQNLSHFRNPQIFFVVCSYTIFFFLFVLPQIFFLFVNSQNLSHFRNPQILLLPPLFSCWFFHKIYHILGIHKSFFFHHCFLVCSFTKSITF
jgi:Kef-type K+ transport system membrane component KefB